MCIYHTSLTILLPYFYIQVAMVRTDVNIRGRISIYDVLDERVDEDRFNMSDYIQVSSCVSTLL